MAENKPENLPLILIVDDEVPIRLLISETLSSEKVRLAEVGDGETALALARQEKPRLILLDMAMPGLSGLEVCQQLKADPATQGIIIAILTAHSQRGDRDKAEASGADYFLTKPFSPVQLLKFVSGVI